MPSGHNFTKKELIDIVKKFVKDKGRTPKYNDMTAKNGYCAGTTFYNKYFKTWKEVLNSSGYDVPPRYKPFAKYTDDDLVDRLIEFVQKLGRIPKQHDFYKYNWKPNSATYAARFGSWNKALLLIGIIRKRHAKECGPSPLKIPRERIIQALQKYFNENHRVPRENDCTPKNGLPSGNVLYHEFGSFNNALRAAGLPVTHVCLKSERPHKDVLLTDIKNFYAKFGRSPKVMDVTKANGFSVTLNVYYDMFGCIWNKILKKAGVPGSRPWKLRDEELLNSLKKSIKKHKRIPTQAEFKKFGLAHSTSYWRRFGNNYENILKLVGINTRRDRGWNSTKYTTDELKRCMRTFVLKHRRIPTVNDFLKSGLPSFKTYELRFGGWNEALKSCAGGINTVRNKKDKKILEDSIHECMLYGMGPSEISDFLNLPLTKIYNKVHNIRLHRRIQ